MTDLTTYAEWEYALEKADYDGPYDEDYDDEDYDEDPDYYYGE